MAGLLNHPKLPLLSGGLSLVLLAGGMYLTLQEEEGAQQLNKDTAQVEKKPAPTAVKVVFELPVKPATTDSVEIAAQAELRPTEELKKQQLEKKIEGGTTILAEAKIEKEELPTKLETIQPVMPRKEETLPKTSPKTSFKLNNNVVVVERAKILKSEARVTPATEDSPAKTALASDHTSKEEASTSKEKSREAAMRWVERTPVVMSTESNKTDDYTEIHVTKPSPNLAVKPDARGSIGPTLVTTSGGKAWVRISAQKTIVVKAGEDLADLGKVISIGPYDLVAEKGKLMLNKE